MMVWHSIFSISERIELSMRSVFILKIYLTFLYDKNTIVT